MCPAGVCLVGLVSWLEEVGKGWNLFLDFGGSLPPSPAQLVIRLRSLVGDATSVCVCGLSPLPLALDKDELNRLGSHTSIFLAAAEEEEEFLIHHRFTIVSSRLRRPLFWSILAVTDKFGNTGDLVCRYCHPDSCTGLHLNISDGNKS